MVTHEDSQPVTNLHQPHASQFQNGLPQNALRHATVLGQAPLRQPRAGSVFTREDHPLNAFHGPVPQQLPARGGRLLADVFSELTMPAFPNELSVADCRTANCTQTILRSP